MSRLMLSSSSSKKDSSSSSSLDASVPASASASAPAFLSSSVPVGSGMISEDSVNQVDQFLREALQNPRERLSSELPRSRKRCMRFKNKVPRRLILLSDLEITH